MSTETGYNGWSNRATWAVALHLGNDCSVQNEWEERTAEVCRECKNTPPKYSFQTWQDTAIYQLEDELKAWVEEGIEDALDAGDFFTSLISDLIPDVDWREITEGWVEDWCRYNDSDEEEEEEEDCEDEDDE